MIKNVVEIAISIFAALLAFMVSVSYMLHAGWAHPVIAATLVGITVGVVSFAILQSFQEEKRPYNPDEDEWRGV